MRTRVVLPRAVVGQKILLRRTLILWHVLQIDPASHRVTVGADAELATRTLRAGLLNWIGIAELTAPMRVQAKIRHRHEPAWATIEPAAEGEVAATFDEPQRAVTPGRFVLPPAHAECMYDTGTNSLSDGGAIEVLSSQGAKIADIGSE